MIANCHLTCQSIQIKIGSYEAAKGKENTRTVGILAIYKHNW